MLVGTLELLARKIRSAVRLVRYRGGRFGKRLLNKVQKRSRHYGMRWNRGRRIVAEKNRNGFLRAYNLTRFLGRRILTLHKPFVRAWKRSARAREHRAERRIERRVERRVHAISRGRVPIVIGPWCSEVGFEVLYWVPFLHWLKAQGVIDPARVIVVSRGGVVAWYEGICSTYVEIFDLLTSDAFTTKNAARRETTNGSHKQFEISKLDQEILDAVKTRLGLSRVQLCHPLLMYGLFRNFWLGHRPLSHVEGRTRFVPPVVPQTADLSSLPSEFAAVKVYSARSLPDEPNNRRIIETLVAQLSKQLPVVSLDTGLDLDDHADYRLDRDPKVFNLSGLMTPQNNLALQTQVIARAKCFVGTCGSLAWLAPRLGTNTVALMSDARHLHPHLYFARKVFLQARASTFATLDVNALASFGFVPAQIDQLVGN